MGLTWDQFYMETAERLAGFSKATRKKVGCVVVKGGKIISMGYNGTPNGLDNTCEEPHPIFPEQLVTKQEVIHAEVNALAKLAKEGTSCEGATLYVTLAPCIECCKLIIQCGISRVVFKHAYRCTKGLDLLSLAKIPADQWG